MKVGDLVTDGDGIGVIIQINQKSWTNHYRIVSTGGHCNWFPKEYANDELEVLYESR